MSLCVSNKLFCNINLQYMWSSGYGYDIYGLTLAASTMVPLQGFWNFCVYAVRSYVHLLNALFFCFTEVYFSDYLFAASQILW